MNVSNVRRIVIDNVPALQMDIDGKTATLLVNQKRTILEDYGAVFLGDNFEDDTSITIPDDPSKGQRAQKLDGYTDDKEVVRLYREFLADSDK